MREETRGAMDEKERGRERKRRCGAEESRDGAEETRGTRARRGERERERERRALERDTESESAHARDLARACPLISYQGHARRHVAKRVSPEAPDASQRPQKGQTVRVITGTQRGATGE